MPELEGWTEEDEREQDALRHDAYETYLATGSRSMGDLDLRAAAQHAQIVGNTLAEREINGVLEVREARHG